MAKEVIKVGSRGTSKRKVAAGAQNCKKIIGRYNIKYYSDDKIGEIIKSRHSDHVKSGHGVVLRRVKYKNKISKL